MNDHRSPAGVPPHVLAYLHEHRTLTLATASPAGAVHAATLLYASDDLTLYCWSRPTTVTVRHIEHNPSVAFTIDEYVRDWTKTKGIQGSGACQLLRSPAEIEHVVSLFGRKFSLVRPPADDLVYFAITPLELRFIDNEAAVGERTQPDARDDRALGQPYHRSLVYSAFLGQPHQEETTVAPALDSAQVPAGTVIVRQGEAADTFFIVVDGEVEVLREEDGERRRVATLGRGQFFGETGILRDMPRTATVRAVTPTTLLTFGREAFRELVAQSLGTTADFDRVIHERLRGLGMAPPPAGEAGQ